MKPWEPGEGVKRFPQTLWSSRDKGKNEDDNFQIATGHDRARLREGNIKSHVGCRVSEEVIKENTYSVGRDLRPYSGIKRQD